MNELFAFLIIFFFIFGVYECIRLLYKWRFEIEIARRRPQDYEIDDEVILNVEIEDEIIPTGTNGTVISKFFTNYGNVHLNIKFDGYENPVEISLLNVDAIQKIDTKQKRKNI